MIDKGELEVVVGNKLTVILITGKSGSGKSTFGTVLEYYLNRNVKCATTIHNAIHVKRIAKNCFNWDGEKDYTGRQLLIDITNTGYSFDPNFWEKQTLRDYHAILDTFLPEVEYLIIPDWRYKCTEDFFRTKADRVITVEITNESRVKGTHDSHDSEIRYTRPDIIIDNVLDPSTPPSISLIPKVEEFVKVWLKPL